MADDPSNWTRPRVAAGALFFDDDDRILLLRPSYKDYWDIPGGYVEVDETPFAACVREVKEELGIDTAPLTLLVADWAPHPTEGDKLLFVFDGGILSPDDLNLIQLQMDEVLEYKFFDADELERVLIPRLINRVRTAILVRASGGEATYLEHGSIPFG